MGGDPAGNTPHLTPHHIIAPLRLGALAAGGGLESGNAETRQIPNLKPNGIRPIGGAVGLKGLRRHSAKAAGTLEELNLGSALSVIFNLLKVQPWATRG